MRTHSFAAARGGIGQPRAALEQPRDAGGGAADDGGDGGGAAASVGADGEFFDAMDYDDGGFEGRASCTVSTVGFQDKASATFQDKARAATVHMCIAYALQQHNDGFP